MKSHVDDLFVLQFFRLITLPLGRGKEFESVARLAIVDATPKKAAPPSLGCRSTIFTPQFAQVGFQYSPS